MGKRKAMLEEPLIGNVAQLQADQGSVILVLSYVLAFGWGRWEHIEKIWTAEKYAIKLSAKDFHCFALAVVLCSPLQADDTRAKFKDKTLSGAVTKELYRLLENSVSVFRTEHEYKILRLALADLETRYGLQALKEGPKDFVPSDELFHKLNKAIYFMPVVYHAFRVNRFVVTGPPWKHLALTEDVRILSEILIQLKKKLRIAKRSSAFRKLYKKKPYKVWGVLEDTDLIKGIYTYGLRYPVYPMDMIDVTLAQAIFKQYPKTFQAIHDKNAPRKERVFPNTKWIIERLRIITKLYKSTLSKVDAVQAPVSTSQQREQQTSRPKDRQDLATKPDLSKLLDKSFRPAAKVQRVKDYQKQDLLTRLQPEFDKCVAEVTSKAIDEIHIL